MIKGELTDKNKLVGQFSMGNRILVSKGSSKRLKLSVMDDNDGSAYNLSDKLLTMTVKRNVDDPDSSAIIQHTSTELLKSTVQLLDTLSAATLTLDARTAGVAGNNLSVSTTLSNKFSTSLNNGGVLSNDDTSATLTDAGQVVDGSILLIDDTTNSTILRVNSKVGNLINFDAISGLAAPITDGATVTELSFNIEVKVSGTTQETHNNVSMEVNNLADYVVTRLTNDSTLIDAVVLTSGSGLGARRPANVTDESLAGGSEFGGIEITDAPAGLAEVQLEKEDTNQEREKQYWYDVRLEDNTVDPPLIETIIKPSIFEIGHTVTDPE